MKVFVGRQIPADGWALLRDAPEITELVVWPHERPATPAELQSSLRDCAGFLAVPPDRVDDKLLKAAPKLRVVSNHAVGVDNIDLDACHRRDVKVGNTPDVLTDTTADVTWALLMATAWRVPEGDRFVREGNWQGWKPIDYWGSDISGATLGIVGFGRIGQAVARRARGFAMNVVYWNRTPRAAEAAALGARYVEIEELLRCSDFVSMHCALTEETRGLMGAARLAMMKKSAILINTARGAVVDQSALAEALSSGTIRGAGLDVFAQEPLPRSDALVARPNVVLLPHLGSATEKTRNRMAVLAAHNLLAALRGEPLPHSV